MSTSIDPHKPFDPATADADALAQYYASAVIGAIWEKVKHSFTTTEGRNWLTSDILSMVAATLSVGHVRGARTALLAMAREQCTSCADGRKPQLDGRVGWWHARHDGPQNQLYRACGAPYVHDLLALDRADFLISIQPPAQVPVPTEPSNDDQ